MGSFLKKLLPKNIAGIIGLIQSAIPVIRELLMVITRLCAIVIPGDRDDKIIAAIKKGFDAFEGVFEKIKWLQQENASLKMKIYALQEMLSNVMSNPKELFRQIKEVIDIYEIQKDREEDEND